MTPLEFTARLRDIGASDLVDATKYSSAQLAEIASCIDGQANSFASRPLGYVVSGSLARLEALEASDVDLIALCPASVGPELSVNLIKKFAPLWRRAYDATFLAARILQDLLS